MRVKAVIFDLDDTLLQTARVKWAHHRHTALHSYGIELTDEIILEHWGKPLSIMVGELYNHSDTPEAMLAANRETEHMFRKLVFDDAVHTVETLLDTGFLVGVITSTTTEFARTDLERHLFPVERMFTVQGEDLTDTHKPDPAVFDPALELLDKVNIDRSDVVYVGDALIDHVAASTAGLQFIGVATGLVTAEQMLNAGISLVVDRVSGVLDVLKSP